jgi:hypothetical protein
MARSIRNWSQWRKAAAAGLLVASAGLGMHAPVSADSEKPASPPPSIFELTKPQVPNANKGMSDSVRESILMPGPAPVQEWVQQPDGSMKNTRTGVTMMIKNVCAPGDMEHEAALDAFRRAQARKNR